MLKRAPTWIASTVRRRSHRPHAPRRRHRAEIGGPQGHRLEEAESSTHGLVYRCGTPVAVHRLDRLLTENVRRDRAVARRSEGTLVERGDERREELPLGFRPVRLAAHGDVEHVRERPAEDLRPVVERLDHVARRPPARPRSRPASRAPPGRARIRRRRASCHRLQRCAQPAETHSDRRRHRQLEISSSERPASRSSATSRSVTLYAPPRTLSRYAAAAGGDTRSGRADSRRRSISWS